MSTCSVCNRLSTSTALLISGFGHILLVGHSMYVAALFDRSSLVFFATRHRDPSGAAVFMLYVVDLMELIEVHGMSPYLYADDVQVDGSRRPSNVGTFSSSISDCLWDVSSWMKSNRLPLNSSEVSWWTNKSAPAPPTRFCTVGRWCCGWSGDVGARPWDIHWRWPEHEDPRTANYVWRVFSRTSPVATVSPARTTNYVSDIGGRSCSVATRLRQRRADRLTCFSCTSASVVRTDASTRLIHHLRHYELITWRARQFTLAARIRAYSVQDRQAGIQSSPRGCSTLSGFAGPCVWFTVSECSASLFCQY